MHDFRATCNVSDCCCCCCSFAAEARLREQNDQLKRVEERLSLATLHLQRAEELKQKENSKKQTHNSIVGEISDVRFEVQ
jgi:hypothetical protein